MLATIAATTPKLSPGTSAPSDMRKALISAMKALVATARRSTGARRPTVGMEPTVTARNNRPANEAPAPVLATKKLANVAGITACDLHGCVVLLALPADRTG